MKRKRRLIISGIIIILFFSLPYFFSLRNEYRSLDDFRNERRIVAEMHRDTFHVFVCDKKYELGQEYLLLEKRGEVYRQLGRFEVDKYESSYLKQLNIENSEYVMYVTLYTVKESGDSVLIVSMGSYSSEVGLEETYVKDQNGEFLQYFDYSDPRSDSSPCRVFIGFLAKPLDNQYFNINGEKQTLSEWLSMNN